MAHRRQDVTPGGCLCRVARGVWRVIVDAGAAVTVATVLLPERVTCDARTFITVILPTSSASPFFDASRDHRRADGGDRRRAPGDRALRADGRAGVDVRAVPLDLADLDALPRDLATPPRAPDARARVTRCSWPGRPVVGRRPASWSSSPGGALHAHCRRRRRGPCARCSSAFHLRAAGGIRLSADAPPWATRPSSPQFGLRASRNQSRPSRPAAVTFVPPAHAPPRRSRAACGWGRSSTCRPARRRPAHPRPRRRGTTRVADPGARPVVPQPTRTCLAPVGPRRPPLREVVVSLRKLRDGGDLQALSGARARRRRPRAAHRPRPARPPRLRLSAPARACQALAAFLMVTAAAAPVAPRARPRGVLQCCPPALHAGRRGGEDRPLPRARRAGGRGAPGRSPSRRCAGATTPGRGDFAAAVGHPRAGLGRGGRLVPAALPPPGSRSGAGANSSAPSTRSSAKRRPPRRTSVAQEPRRPLRRRASATPRSESWERAFRCAPDDATREQIKDG